MLTLLSTPITGTEGFYENVFPSQAPVEYKFNRQDTVINSVTSGTNGNARIQTDDDLIDLEVGDFITWETNGYTLKSSRVSAKPAANQIEVLFPFSTTNSINGWCNFRKRWYVEARYVRSVTATDEQNALEIIDFRSEISNSKNGDVTLDCSLVSDILDPKLDLVEPEQKTFSTTFKIQYRESWLNNREEDWISPDPDVPVLLIHGSRDIPSDGFIDDTQFTRKFWRGYPLFVNYVHSFVNDQDTNRVQLFANRRRINKTLIETIEEVNELAVNGLVVFKILPEDVSEETTFINFESLVTSEKFQYDPEQYDPTQYA